MHGVDRVSCDLQGRGHRPRRGFGAVVGIAANNRHRSDLLQAVEDRLWPHVARMHDGTDAPERRKCFGT